MSEEWKGKDLVLVSASWESFQPLGKELDKQEQSFPVVVKRCVGGEKESKPAKVQAWRCVLVEGCQRS